MFLFFTRKGFCVRVQVPDPTFIIFNKMEALIIFPVDIRLSGDSVSSAEGRADISVESGLIRVTVHHVDYNMLKANLIQLIDEIHAQL